MGLTVQAGAALSSVTEGFRQQPGTNISERTLRTLLSSTSFLSSTVDRVPEEEGGTVSNVLSEAVRSIGDFAVVGLEAGGSWSASTPNLTLTVAKPHV